MEVGLSGNSLRTFSRCITCLSRIGNELVIQASPSEMVFHTLNSSRSAYQALNFKPDFFDSYTLSVTQLQCSFLLKAVCSIFRTPVASIDHLRMYLVDSDAAKIQWTLNCYNGMKKTYWISCNSEPEIQHLSLDKRRFPSNFVVKPREFNKLLTNFQSSLSEITIIATEPAAVPADAAGEIGGKAVELRSYIDPTKDESDAALHTQLWIDPSEEFVHYIHVGNAVDVTFSVKELKAFLAFCEGCEVDIQLFFEKAGEPILMAPKFGVDDGRNSDFDATLVLATMLSSQLHDGNTSNLPQAAPETRIQGDSSTRDHSRVVNTSPDYNHPSNHTRIWSELSGSFAKSSNGVKQGQALQEITPNCGMQNENREHPETDILVGQETNLSGREQERVDLHGKVWSQRNPSNWIGPDDDEDEDEELCVNSTPQF